MERFFTKSAAMLFPIREVNGKTEILLQQRKGWAAGKWDAAVGGHVDANEPMTACVQREAKEEIDIEISKDDIIFVNIQHNISKDSIYYDGHFFIKGFKGTPRICEPDKIGDLRWFDIDNLPDNMIDRRLQAIIDFKNGVTYTEFGWDK